tara:strand:+ start:220 stop:468 length:249 start_codon:yes stop_codon:yes gene_type:complete
MEIANGHNNMSKEDLKMIDNVNHPKHYTNGKIEPIDYINGNDMDYLEGNIIKYISRYKFKNGLEDLEKARFYLNMLIERESK